MPFDATRHHRRSVRLPGYDYAQPGAYFVTLCVQHHLCLFGEVEEDTVRLSTAGEIVRACWNALPAHFPRVVPDAFVVMPNHVHAIIGIVDDGAMPGDACVAPTTVRPGPPVGSLGAIVGSWKSAATRHIRLNGHSAFAWQRSYYERVLRTPRELERTRCYIRDYIRVNPLRWDRDRLHPDQPARPSR